MHRALGGAPCQWAEGGGYQCHHWPTLAEERRHNLQPPHRTRPCTSPSPGQPKLPNLGPEIPYFLVQQPTTTVDCRYAAVSCPTAAVGCAPTAVSGFNEQLGFREDCVAPGVVVSLHVTRVFAAANVSVRHQRFGDAERRRASPVSRAGHREGGQTHGRQESGGWQQTTAATP